MSVKKKWFPFLWPVLLAVVLLVGGWAWLAGYTRHNVKVNVPDMKGMTVEEATKLLAERDLLLEVIDSVYDDKARKGTVTMQDPEAGQNVKPDRKIFVTMNATQPKMLNMPALVNMSKRQAISTLDIIGLKVKELQYRPDPCLDCVVAQLFKDKPIDPETRIRRGESVTLVLGSGANGERVSVPDLQGLVLAEVGMVLNLASLNLGVVVACEGCNTQSDSAFARVQRQSPSAGMNNMISIGSAIDVWLTSDTTGLHPMLDLDSIKNSTPDTNATH